MRGRHPRSGAALAAAAAALGVAACFLPQPLAEVSVDGGTVTITPPRIVTDSLSPGGTEVRLARGCPGGAVVTLSATVRDDNTLEPIEARWFVDYDPARFGGAQPYHVDVVPAPDDVTQTDRPLPPLPLALPATDPASGHVLDLVVSNGFYPLDDPEAPLRNRSAQPGYETQIYRWVFQYVDTGGACVAP